MPPPDPFQPPSPEPKQAVVLIHGMGEQEPMGTIRDFVKAVWETDPDLRQKPPPHETWIKPDIRTGLQELKRITTRTADGPGNDPAGYRTDFFELYWADLNKGSTLSEIENWICGLLLRNPVKLLPRSLWPAWVLLLLICALVLYLALLPVLGSSFAIPFAKLSPHPLSNDAVKRINDILTYVFGAVAGVASRWMLANIGCVVKYTSAKPENIAARNAIRKRGLDLLEALHDGTYERIIIVGHSLGTILGYDLLSLFWGSHTGGRSFTFDRDELAPLIAVEHAAKELRTAGDEAALTRAQTHFDNARRVLARTLRTRSLPSQAPDRARRWLITDFITLGSPLTYSEFLLYPDKEEFDRRVKTREVAIAPPVEEKLDNPAIRRLADQCDLPHVAGLPYIGMEFPFPMKSADGSDAKFWQLHFASQFAVVRWTNIYAPSHWFYLKGDVISGPLAKRYGPGVRDINLDKSRQTRWFAHTKYWALDKDGNATPAVQALRQALNLGCRNGI